MSKKNILLAITNGLWLIDLRTAEQLGPNIASLLQGKEFWNEKHKAEHEFLIVGAGASGSYFSDSLSKAKAGSIAVIPISGPIMKYDNCGDPGSKTYEDLVKQADANPNITGIIFQIDSGGGEVAGTQSLASVIKAVNKPTVTIAEDLMASAAYWIGSSTDYIFANTNTTMVGSIGTMISFRDMRPMWEAQGVKFHEIYASDSTLKNNDYAEALKENYEPIQKNVLNPLNKVFMDSVKANRGDKLNADMTLKGQMYTANDALKHGLIDGIGDLNAAIDKINELASGEIQTTTTAKTENQINMKKITLLASHACLLAICGATISAGENSVDVEMNDELLNKINASLDAAAKASADLVTANEKVTAAELKAKEEEAKATKAVNDLTTAEAKIRTLETAGSTNATTTAFVEETSAEAKENDITTAADAELAAYKKSLNA
jgi:protease-4